MEPALTPDGAANPAVKWIDLSSHPLYGPNGPRPADVKQGEVGDCYDLAFEAELALRHPQLLASRIEDHHNGTFTVHFADWRPPKSVPAGAPLEPVDVVVDSRFPATHGQPLYSRLSASGALWPLVLEKAYAKLFDGYGNIRAGYAIRPAFRLLGWRQDQMLRLAAQPPPPFVAQVQQCFHSGGMVTLYTPPKPANGVEPPGWPTGMVHGHMYSVLSVRKDVDASGQPLCWFRIRNPWGSHSPHGPDIIDRGDGTFDMRARQVRTAFAGVELLRP